VTYLSGRAVVKLAYQWTGKHLIGGEGTDLTDEVVISYKGAAVPRLSSTNVVLWNAGTQTFRGSDIVESDPLRIELPQDAQILRITVTKRSRPVNQFAARVDSVKKNQAICTFDYLDQGDGVRLEMLHTCEKRRPMVRGTIRGLPSGPTSWGRFQADTSDGPRTPIKLLNRTRPLVLAFALGLGCTAILIGLLATLIRARFPDAAAVLDISPSKPLRVALVLAGLLYAVPSFLLLFFSRRRFPKALGSDD
jgi:hypothetical protein